MVYVPLQHIEPILFAKKVERKKVILYIYWRLIAQSTVQGHLRAFHTFKSRTSWIQYNNKTEKKKWKNGHFNGLLAVNGKEVYFQRAAVKESDSLGDSGRELCSHGAGLTNAPTTSRFFLNDPRQR